MTKIKENDYTKVCNIYSTYDYDLFKQISVNREIDQTRLSRLKASMTEKQLIIPILVNKNMEIIDGQHRFEAIKQLGLPVYFYVQDAYDIKDMICANLNTQSWKKGDFFNHYVRLGIDTYLFIKNMMDKYNVASESIEYVALNEKKKLGEKTSERKEKLKFLQGNLIYSPEIKAKIISFFDKIALLKSWNFRYYNSKSFIRAYYALVNNPNGYEDKKLTQEKVARIIVNKQNIVDFGIQLMKAYNSSGNSKNKIAFDEKRKVFYCI